MKKTIIIMPVILAVMILSGCGKKQVQDENQNKNTNTNQNQGATQNKEQEREGERISDTIKSAMESGKKMKCVYSVEIGGQKYQNEMYIDNGKFKTVATINGDKNYSISDGDMFYAWSEKEMKGSKMSKQCTEDLKDSADAPPTAENMKTDPEDFDAGAMDVQCEPVSSVDLTVPSNVTFTDNCETLKKSMELMKQYQNQGTGAPITPPQVTIPEGLNQ